MQPALSGRDRFPFHFTYTNSIPINMTLLSFHGFERQSGHWTALFPVALGYNCDNSMAALARGSSPSAPGVTLLQLHDLYLAALQRGDRAAAAQALSDLRRGIIDHGVPDTPVVRMQNESRELTVRGRLWKLLLRVKQVDASVYLQLIERKEYVPVIRVLLSVVILL
jgi:hypothetical protein